MVRDPVVVNLLALYAAILGLNTALSAALWFSKRTSLHAALAHAWGLSAVMFVVQALVGEQELPIVLGFATIFLPNLALARLVSLTLDVPLYTRLFIAVLLVGCVLAVGASMLGVGFTWTALPVVVAVALPLSVTALAAIRGRWRVMGVTRRALTISCLLFAAHNLDFAVLRPIPEATAPGFTIAIIIMLALSITAPAVVLELAAERQVRAETELAAAQRLKRYFPKALVDTLLEGERDLKLSGERRNITIFFSDLSGFTELSDRIAPERVATLLNEYLNAMFAVMDSHGCTLDKVMGDGIMGFFGAPKAMPAEEQAWRAVSMAICMQRRFDALAADWRKTGLDHEIQVRIGLHQEYAMVGNIGSSELMSYTAIGSGVNLASRFESMCEPGGLLAGYPVYALTAARFPWSEPEVHAIKGFAREQKCYRLDPRRVETGSLWSEAGRG